METNVVPIEIEKNSAPDTKDGEDQNLSVDLDGNSDHTLSGDGSTRINQMTKEEPIINKPMYPEEDWETFYELRSLDGRKTDMCCLKACTLRCYYSMRVKLSRTTPIAIGDPNIFVIPTTGLPPDDAVSAADVCPEVPSTSTAIFDARTGTIERKRKFTLMSTVMEIPDKDGEDSNQLLMKYDKIPIMPTVTSKDTNDVIGLKSRSDTSIDKIQRDKNEGICLRVFRWVRRKLRI